MAQSWFARMEDSQETVDHSLITECIMVLDGLLESLLRDSSSTQYCNIGAASLKREKHSNSDLKKLVFIHSYLSDVIR